VTRRTQLILIGAILALVALGAVLRNPIRHALKTGHAPSHGRLQNPEGLAIDRDGNFYVSNQDSGEFTILDKSGKVIKQWGDLEGYHDGQGRPSRFCRGLYVTVPEPFHVFMTAIHNGVEFDAQGDKPKLIRIFGSQGAAPGQVDGPEGISRDANGDVYMTSEHNREIVVFDKEGKHLRSWSVPQDPQTVTVWKDRVYVSLDKRNYCACYSKEGVEQFRNGHEAAFPMILYVTLPCAILSLVAFTALGKAKLAWGLLAFFLALACAGSGWDFWRHHQPGEFRLPDDMVVSPDGKELFIVDRLNNRIQVTDLEGHLKRVFGRTGTATGHLNDPKQLAFDPDGNLWVCDSDNHRLQCFTPDGKFLKLLE